MHLHAISNVLTTTVPSYTRIAQSSDFMKVLVWIVPGAFYIRPL